MTRSIYAIRLKTTLVIATEVLPRKAAKLFDAGQTILIASQDPLKALANHQQRVLVVKRRGLLSPATLTRTFKITLAGQRLHAQPLPRTGESISAHLM